MIDSFDGGAQLVLNLVLGAMIFGLSLGIAPVEFKSVLQKPKAPLVGTAAQFLILPLVTFLMTTMVDLPAPIELGMILVAACPGGAISNFVTLLARGNTALSITMTAISSLLAIFLLPINFGFWANLNPVTHDMLRSIEVNSTDILNTLLLVLALPIIMGQIIRHLSPKFAHRVQKILKPVSVIVLLSFIGFAVSANFAAFKSQFGLILSIVFIHNAVALLIGYLAAKSASIKGADGRAITIEVGLQNSSLAIAIIYSNFAGQADMALIAAFWGIWHIVSGLCLSGAFRLYDQHQIKAA